MISPLTGAVTAILSFGRSDPRQAADRRQNSAEIIMVLLDETIDLPAAEIAKQIHACAVPVIIQMTPLDGI